MSRPRPDAMTQAQYDDTIETLTHVRGLSEEEARAVLAGITITDAPPPPPPLPPDEVP